MLVDTSKSPYAAVTPVGSGDVSWTAGFWKDATDTCNVKTVPHLRRMFEAPEISHVVENFRICANPEDTRGHSGTDFGDGDFYKWMESAMYAAAANHDQKLFDEIEEYVQLIGRAQLPDGYISTKQIIAERNGTGKRLGNVNEFEVYNMGHMFTSACVYYRLTGRDSFMKIASKAADYLEQMYHDALEKDEVQTAVCPSHYMGLIEMYRTTGEKRYLDLARTAIEARDHVKNGMDDNQDRLPLKTHRKIVGHAVRATYLYAGVADLYAEEGDGEYLSMLHRVWDNMVSSKIYVTGGVGALYNGASPYGYFFRHNLVHQAFGYEYQLPNVTAYNETCASLGLVFWAYRMFLIEPKAEYMDILERAMLNVNLAAVSLDGEYFFYENMLRRTKKLDYRLIWRLRRSKYINSYCCPPNLARTISQSEEYAYTVSGNQVYLGLYGASEAKLALDDCAFTLVQKTGYPYDGKIEISAKDVTKAGVCRLMIRVPGWVQDGYVQTLGSEQSDGKRILTKEQAGSYIEVPMTPGKDKVVIYFDMPVRYTTAHPLVEECVNQAAVERGPLVYCIETPDADVETLDELMLNLNTDWKLQDYTIENRTVTALEGQMYRRPESADGLYRTLDYKGLEPVNVRMIPYFAWDNRSVKDDGTYDMHSIKHLLDTPDDMEYDEMRVWIPVAYQ